jgi:FixJ family two-component response regulator
MTNRAPEPAPVIAIVDDDASWRSSTQRLIRSFGYRAEVFAGPREFLGSDAAESAACLLLDVRMPGMDGLEVQRALARLGACIPLVFVTGRASDEQERRARAAGAVEFLRKPVPQADLRRVVESAVRAARERCVSQEEK